MSALELITAGDLINQLMPSSLMARSLGRPFLGLYGACSTFAEGALIGGTMVEGGFRKNALCAASSHFCTAERQFRFPLELGTQRPPAAQWTATAAGAMLVDREKAPAQARLTHGTIGRVVDFEVTDANHTGALYRHGARFFGLRPDHYRRSGLYRPEPLKGAARSARR